jgi:hypothetical protein
MVLLEHREQGPPRVGIIIEVAADGGSRGVFIPAQDHAQRKMRE